MVKIREIFRLSLMCGMGNREIARSLKIAPATVGNYLRRAASAGLTSAQVMEMNEGELLRLLMGDQTSGTCASRPLPDWGWVYQELTKKGVTLQLLWEEYKEIHPEGYQLTQFYEHYRRFKGKLDVSMRLTHKGGEKLFVDFAGQRVVVRDRVTGKVREAQIFVAVLGASNYTYAEAVWDQSLASWIGSHVRAFEYFGGVPRAIVPDNLRSGVSKACRYEPDINPTYQDMASHYGTAILPARVRKPKDKAKVEVGVQVVERWILAVLRNRTFFSLSELNEAIRELLVRLNGRPFQKLPGSRRSWFEEVEKEALLSLPESRYVFAEWKRARVNIDYHVELFRHYYSVPYPLVHEEVQLRYTTATVEVLHRGKQVASHKRDYRPGRHTTVITGAKGDWTDPC